MHNRFVAYYRVSTKQQGRSGLGLEAQKVIVNHFSAKDAIQVEKEFTDIESGKEMNNRPALRSAIEFCKKEGCGLMVAKLDRLSRDVEHVFRIKKLLGEGRLVCCDLPSTDSLTLSIFAGLAQREREIISIRTQAALAAKKRQGVKLGKPENFNQQARIKGAAAMKKRSQLNPELRKAIPLANELRSKGKTLQEIADDLNKYGFVTARGKNFQRTSVSRILSR